MSQPAPNKQDDPQLPAKVSAPLDHVPLDALRAMKRGDRDGYIAAIKAICVEDSELPVRLAQVALELRRENVAVIGGHEAFVRHTAEGSLHQVVRPVHLSLGDKSLYQIPKRLMFFKNSDNRAFGKYDKAKHDWRDEKSSTADLTFFGLQKLNAVAGCAVGQPPQVNVDGEMKTNPYVQRARRKNSTRPGDIERVVIMVVVVGPAPATGNLVAVTYTLDYDPSKDLQHMLSAVAKNHEDECYLVSEDDEQIGEKGWQFVPIHGGVGWVFNLRTDKVRQVYSDFINICQNAVKKAQTVARRNAMKQHPALAIPTVLINDRGGAVVAVTGWAQDTSAHGQWQQTMDRLSRGIPMPELEHVETIDAVYEAEEEPQEEDEAEVSEADAELIERNRVIAYINDGLLNVSPSQAGELEFDDDATLDELKAIKGRIDNMLDALE